MPCPGMRVADCEENAGISPNDLPLVLDTRFDEPSVELTSELTSVDLTYVGMTPVGLTSVWIDVEEFYEELWYVRLEFPPTFRRFGMWHRTWHFP